MRTCVNCSKKHSVSCDTTHFTTTTCDFCHRHDQCHDVVLNSAVEELMLGGITEFATAIEDRLELLRATVLMFRNGDGKLTIHQFNTLADQIMKEKYFV